MATSVLHIQCVNPSLKFTVTILIHQFNIVIVRLLRFFSLNHSAHTLLHLKFIITGKSWSQFFHSILKSHENNFRYCHVIWKNVGTSFSGSGRPSWELHDSQVKLASTLTIPVLAKIYGPLKIFLKCSIWIYVCVFEILKKIWPC